MGSVCKGQWTVVQVYDIFVQEESEQEPLLDDAKEMLPGKAYHWRDWCICRGRDCLYIWSDAAALELSNGSNGWFRFILDGKLATMYSSGSPEGGTDSSGEWLNKLQFYSVVTWNCQALINKHFVFTLFACALKLNNP